MTTAALLNENQAKKILAENKRYAKQITDSAHSDILPSNRFIFFAAFDGTGNTLTNTNKSNPQTTNVGQLWTQYKDKTSERYGGGYFAGPGTTASIRYSAWLKSAVTDEVEATAERGYKQFEEQARAWFEADSGRERAVCIVVTAFSRGVAAAAIFSRLLYERGLTTAEGKKLISPQKISVSAGILFDPVTTGVACSVAFAPVTTNVVVVFAMNEYRHLFLSTNYRQEEGIKTVNMLGNHCDIGGGYDNGVGALTLDAATTFFRECGLENMSKVPSDRAFVVPSADALIHSEGSLNGSEDVQKTWSAYRDFESQPEDFEPATRSVVALKRR